MYLQEWKPRFGYKRGNDETQEWLLEVPQNAGTEYHKFTNLWWWLQNITWFSFLVFVKLSMCVNSEEGVCSQVWLKKNIVHWNVTFLGKITSSTQFIHGWTGPSVLWPDSWFHLLWAAITLKEHGSLLFQTHSLFSSVLVL